MLWRTVKAADGSVRAINGCIIGDERLHGWLMVGPPVSGVSAASLCYWDLMKWSLPRGLAYDLGGVPNEGIRKFKISVGADAETFVTATRIRPQVVYKPIRALYNWTKTRRATREGA